MIAMILRVPFVAIVLLASVFSTVACGIHTAAFRDVRGHPIPRSVATMTDATIGGVTQRLWFRSLDALNPPVILLHGGPGTSEAALFRHFNADLENRFLMVYWEQRGTGRWYTSDIPAASMTIEQFVRDLDEVVDLVRDRFGGSRWCCWGTRGALRWESCTRHDIRRRWPHTSASVRWSTWRRVNVSGTTSRTPRPAAASTAVP